MYADPAVHCGDNAGGNSFYSLRDFKRNHAALRALRGGTKMLLTDELGIPYRVHVRLAPAAAATDPAAAEGRPGYDLVLSDVQEEGEGGEGGEGGSRTAGSGDVSVRVPMTADARVCAADGGRRVSVQARLRGERERTLLLLQPLTPPQRAGESGSASSGSGGADADVEQWVTVLRRVGASGGAPARETFSRAAATALPERTVEVDADAPAYPVSACRGRPCARAAPQPDDEQSVRTAKERLHSMYGMLEHKLQEVQQLRQYVQQHSGIIAGAGGEEEGEEEGRAPLSAARAAPDTGYCSVDGRPMTKPHKPASGDPASPSAATAPVALADSAATLTPAAARAAAAHDALVEVAPVEEDVSDEVERLARLLAGGAVAVPRPAAPETPPNGSVGDVGPVDGDEEAMRIYRQIHGSGGSSLDSSSSASRASTANGAAHTA